jgi:hypothetical protein
MKPIKVGEMCTGASGKRYMAVSEELKGQCIGCFFSQKSRCIETEGMSMPDCGGIIFKLVTDSSYQ